MKWRMWVWRTCSSLTAIASSDTKEHVHDRGSIYFICIINKEIHKNPLTPKPSFLAAFSWPCCSHVDIIGSSLVTQLLSVGLIHLNIWLQHKLPLFFFLASNTEGFLSHPQPCPSVPSRTCVGAKCRKEKTDASVLINFLSRCCMEAKVRAEWIFLTQKEVTALILPELILMHPEATKQQQNQTF